jgi:CTD small phosphatase-like protein 2
VLDLDETLVHYVEEEDSAYILVRPGAERFIEETSKYYELVIFTAATQDVILYLNQYADFVLNELDKNRRISYRLYRQHTSQIEGCNNIKVSNNFN